MSVLQEFKDVFPEELPHGLPPLHGIEHRIDLIPGAPLPNRSAYRMKPEETKEIERQINQLVSKGLIQVSTSPSVTPSESALCKFQRFLPNPHRNDSKVPTRHFRAGGKRSNTITQ